MWAAKNSNQEVTALLIDAGANVAHTGADQQNALSLAIVSGNLETVDTLLEAGASPNPVPTRKLVRTR